MYPEDETTPEVPNQEIFDEPSNQADEPAPADRAADQESGSAATELTAKTLEALQARVEREDREALRGAIEGEGANDQADGGDQGSD